MYDTAITIMKMTIALSWYGNSGIVVPPPDDGLVLVELHCTPATLAQGPVEDEVVGWHPGAVGGQVDSVEVVGGHPATVGGQVDSVTVVGLQLMPAGQVVVVVVVWQGARAGSHEVVEVVADVV